MSDNNSNHNTSTNHDALLGAGVSSLLMQAAQSAAQADGVASALAQQPQQDGCTSNSMSPTSHKPAAAASSSNTPHSSPAMIKKMAQQQQQQQSGNMNYNNNNNTNTNNTKGPPLRRGKWTPEEEAYAARLIQEFKAGLLPLTDGTTLRTFLSKLLNCDPMRISKKFVGSNCIGKQVFRRRAADLSRLTPTEIQRSRAELSELERRFLERVQQTNRFKSTSSTPHGAGTGNATAAHQNQHHHHMPAPPPAAAKLSDAGAASPSQQQQQQQQLSNSHAFFNGPNGTAAMPPWLQPPVGYRHGTGLQLAAAAAMGNNNNSSAAAAGRALLLGLHNSNSSNNNNNNKTNVWEQSSTQQLAAAAQQGGSTGMLAIAELQRRASQNSLLSSAWNHNRSSSATNLLAQQLAQSAAASGLGFGGSADGGVSSASMNSLLQKAGFSRDQLSQLTRGGSAVDDGISTGSLSNLVQRQNSFDALMSLDFQSLQSIDNLANLIQSGGGGNVPESGMKNADFGLDALTHAQRRLATAASSSRMESLLRNLSQSNVGGQQHLNDGSSINDSFSSANLSNLLQSMQRQGGSSSSSGQLQQLQQQASASNFFAAAAAAAAARDNNSLNIANSNINNDNANSSVSLANFLRQDSATGLSALRMGGGGGVADRNSTSVDDFLSLMAAGDIPHQDPALLNIPLAAIQQQDAAAKAFLAQQQLLLLQEQSNNSNSNSALANALASRNDAILARAAAAQQQQQQQTEQSSRKRSAEDLTRQGKPKR